MSHTIQESGTSQVSAFGPVRQLLEEVWRFRVTVLCVAVALAVLGGVIGLILEKKYEASTTISPVLDEAGGGRLGSLGALASQYGGLASLAGLTLPGRSKKDEAVAVLQSELLTETYIRDNNLLPVLYANDWDAQANKWRPMDPRKVPTLWKANLFFKKSVRQVTEDRKSGLLILSIRWKDPKVAAQWANDLVKLTNDYLRTKAIDEAERDVQYLTEQAAKTNVVEEKRVIYSLLEDEINRAMVARGREQYALKVIDPAFVPEVSSTPGPKMLAALGFVLGGVLSMLTLLGLRTLRY